MKDSLAALRSSREGGKLSVDHKKLLEPNKTKLEASLKVSEDKLSYAPHPVKELELSMDTVEQVATRVDEILRALADFQEPGQYLEDRVAKRSSQLLGEDNVASVELWQPPMLENQVTSFWTDQQQARIQNTFGRDLLEAVRAVMDLQKAVSQQLITNFFNDR